MNKITEKKKAVSVLLSGEVQNVGLRYEVMQKASKEGVCGLIQNLPDGDVEAIFQGEIEKVDQLIDWLSKEFSPQNRHFNLRITRPVIEKIKVRPLKCSKEDVYRDFAIKQ